MNASPCLHSVQRAVPRGAAALRPAQAGFTLIELMVAMTGGLFLAIIVLALSRDVTRFYQQETRASNATLAGVTGFERLAADIARAGHLASPNIQADPRVCNRPEEVWPDNLENMRALNLDVTGASTASTEVSAASITPMAIEIAGALDNAEELPFSHVGVDGEGAFVVTIRPDTPAASRLNIIPAAAAATANKQILIDHFMRGGVGRVVRIAQLDGMEQYGIVASVESEPTLRLKLAAQPALKLRGSGPQQCGLQGFNTGGTINVVNFVRYELRSMVGDSNYASLFAASSSPGLPYESGRVELIREELKPDGGVIDGTREIISEYAVDLQFSLKQATDPTNPALFEPAVGGVNSTYGSTQLLRSVHARLSVRSREADRDGPISGAAGNGPLLRFPLALDGGGGSSSGKLAYSRVRTLQADIPLRNLESANW